MLALLVTPPVLLALWRFSFPYTCLAYFCPFLCAGFIAHGRYEAAIYKRRFIAGYYLRRRSLLYRLTTGRLVIGLGALIVGVVSAFALAMFTALANQGEMVALGAAWLLTIGFRPIVSRVLRTQVRDRPASVVTKKLTANLSFGFAAVGFVAFALHAPIPDFVDPTSLAKTMDTASQTVASLCACTNFAAKLSQEWTAAFWFGMVSTTPTLGNDVLQFAAWLPFLLQSCLALLGMSWLSVEVASLAQRHITNAATGFPPQ